MIVRFAILAWSCLSSAAARPVVSGILLLMENTCEDECKGRNGVAQQANLQPPSHCIMISMIHLDSMAHSIALE